MKDKILKLQAEINELSDKLDELKKEHQCKLEIFQKSCSHEVWYADSDGDYHKPGYYYTCIECGYFKTAKPSHTELIYR